MSTDELYDLLSQYVATAIVGVFALSLVVFLGYIFFYKGVLKGKRSLTIRHTTVGAILAGYTIIVLCVTFFSRVPDYGRVPILQPFSGYRLAWNSFDLRSWQNNIFNILMFVPLGILLPMFHGRYCKAWRTILLGAIFTLLIETFQLITGYGIFDTGDLLNNMLGTIFGYCLIMSLYTLFLDKGKRWKPFLRYCIPLVIITGSFISVFAVYHFQEFGNLRSAYVYRVNCRDTDFIVQTNLSEERKTVPTYQMHNYKAKELTKMAAKFSEKAGMDTQNGVTTYVESEQTYVYDHKNQKGEASQIKMRKDGTFSYRFVVQGNEKSTSSTKFKENTVRQALSDYGIDLPPDTSCEIGAGRYSFIVNKYLHEGKLFNGSLQCSVQENGAISHIEDRKSVV